MKRFSISVLSVVLLLTFVMGSTYAADPPLVRYLIKIEGPPGNVEKAVNAFGGKVSHVYKIIPEWIAIEIPETAVSGLKRNPRVISLLPDVKVYAIDAELDNSWGVKRIGAGTVHDGGNNGNSVKVGIIDSGIDYNHPDLETNYAGGYDFVNKDADPMDDYGHGTHVAGTVAALDNNVGVVGVAPGASLYALKVLGSDGSGDYSDVIAALEWAMDNGIQVTNNSYGSSGDPGEPVKAAFDIAEAAGVLNVAAAGNSGIPSGRRDNIEYPARYASVIAVAATDNNDTRARWSSTGPALEISAPGVDITSTYLNGGYAIGNGTSMACPHVAGTAALVIAAGIGDVRTQLQTTADDLGDTGWDTKYGYGLVDADEAAAGPTGPKPPVADAGEDQTVSDDDNDGEESVTLDGSGSYDPDGTIVSYEWDTDGDGVTNITGETINTTFDVGSHTVTLTVTDSDELTDTDEVVITVKEPVTGTMYVNSITFEGKKAGRNLFLYTTVEVFDNNDNPLAGATVEMTLTGPGGSWNFTGNTVEDGTVKFTLKTRQTGLYTAKVTNIPDGEIENSCTLNNDGTISSAGSVALNSLDKPMGNYPNPFNPETNIEYGIKETGFVSIKIYNVMGQVVRTLVNEAQSAGFYTVVWNGRDEQGRELSSGIYYCRLTAGEQSAILKMLFLK